ncbi:MAG: bifunctional riboflavin kinase/FAD synthetase [Myxococcales bacterium]|nr:bifunctional riboflavin kinase/FAD synthetase [Myxococcales bacterium]
MWIAHDFRTARCAKATAVAIGNFDGVHIGHRALIERARAEASALGAESVVLTFEPHPTRILAPERTPPRITGADRRLELFADSGVDGVLVQGFDRAFASMTPEQFSREVLLGLRARVVIVGENFHFGRDRSGDGASLRALGQELGFRTEVLGAVLDPSGEMISSSRIRKALADGALDQVRAMLGRPFDFDGRVVMGDQRGRTLGFATANIRTDVEALPRDGVYAVTASIVGERDREFSGVMNIGVRPTFAAGRSIEVHLLDQDIDLYGRLLRVTCVQRIRDERRFSGIDELRAQIAADVSVARSLLATRGA